jgi:hypothetical protein
MTFSDYVQIQDIVHGRNGYGDYEVYALTPEALEALLTRLRELDGDLKECYADKSYDPKIQKPESLLKGRHSWFFSSGRGMAECGHCGNIISSWGVHTHDHRCERCGGITYEENMKGSWVRFCLKQNPQVMFPPEIMGKVVEWDYQKGGLYLDYESLFDATMQRRWPSWVIRGEEALNHLFEKQTYSPAKKGREEYYPHLVGRKMWEEALITATTPAGETVSHKCARFTLFPDHFGEPGEESENTIQYVDSSCHQHYRSGQVWDGVFYGEFSSSMPFPRSIHIYEVWHCPDLLKPKMDNLR